MHGEVLFSESQITERVRIIARQIAALPTKPEVAAPILIGGYVFAADLLRALAREGISLPTEFLWLKRYKGRETAKDVSVLVGPNERLKGKNVLLIDGVLDGGYTMKTARDLILAQGAKTVVTAVVVDKAIQDAVAKADYAAFTGVDDFIVGYGMDDTGIDRALPYIAKAGGD